MDRVVSVQLPASNGNYWLHVAKAGIEFRWAPHAVQRFRGAARARPGQGLNVPSRFSDGQNGQSEITAIELSDCRIRRQSPFDGPNGFPDTRPSFNSSPSWCERLALGLSGRSS